MSEEQQRRLKALGELVLREAEAIFAWDGREETMPNEPTDPLRVRRIRSDDDPEGPGTPVLGKVTALADDASYGIMRELQTLYQFSDVTLASRDALRLAIEAFKSKVLPRL